VARTYRERGISVSDRQRPLDFGPYRAPDKRVRDREPITDGGRVMWGHEREVGYNSSPSDCLMTAYGAALPLGEHCASHVAVGGRARL
jgi:hypothetical protein